MAGDRTIEVWADTLGGPQPCKDHRCDAKLIWAIVVKSGARMCFTAPAVPLRERPATAADNPTTAGRIVAVMDFADNHWSICPGARDFKRGKR